MSRVQRSASVLCARVVLIVALLVGMLPSQAGAGSNLPEASNPTGQGSQQETQPGPIPTPLPAAQWPEAMPQPQYIPSFEQPREPETLPLPPPQPSPDPAQPAPVAENEEPALGLPPGVVTLTLAPEGGRVTAGDLPLALESAAGALAQPLQARVDVLEAAIAGQLSPVQIAFQLSFASATGDREAQPLAQPGQPPQLSLDTSRLALPYGGSFAERLVLYRVSGCAWRTATPEPANDMPLRPQSEEQVLACSRWEALPGVNDRATQRLTVVLDGLEKLGAMDAQAESQTSAPEQKGNPLFLPLVGGGAGNGQESGDESPPAPTGDIYVLAASSGGPQGDYGATPLAKVSDYQVSLATGAATTGYPIPVPPAAAGPAPDVGLTYNSGSVDGMHSSKNNQPGSVGLGWDIQSGYITRHLKGCNISQAPGDLCLTGDNYSIVLNGVSSRLVKETSTLYHLQDDPYWKVEKLINGANGHPDAQTEVWWVTTPDGTRYRFGGEIEPETGYDQDSVFYVTIYDTDPASCGNFTNDLCDKAWQWNLDRIEDTNGNVVSYFYSWEDNYYRARNDSRPEYRKRYVRAGQIARIDYSKRAGTSVQPHARVLFHSELRCTDPTTSSGCAWPSQFPDTPGDLVCEVLADCGQKNRPTFWSQRRLDSIQTQIYDQASSSWKTAAIYDLSQSFPTPPNDAQGDSSEAKLWLDSVTQRPGGSFSRTAFVQQEAEDYDSQSGIGTEDTTDVGRGRNVGWTDTNDYLLYKKVDFGSGANTLLARVASPFSGGQIQFRLDSTGGTLVGTINVPYTGGWQNWNTVTLTLSSPPTGVHDLYLVFTGGLNVNWFRFRPSSDLPGLPAVTYGTVMKANRWESASAVSSMIMPRIGPITTTLGGVVTFTYGQSHPCVDTGGDYIRYPYDCAVTWYYTNPDNPAQGVGTGLFNKWKVTAMTQADSFSGNETQSYTYSYSTPTWHYSDDPALPDYGSCSGCVVRLWNDFRGSEVVTVTDGSGAKTEHRFFRGMNGDRLGTGGGVFGASITVNGIPPFSDNNWWRGREVETRRLKSDNSPVQRTVNWYMGTSTAGSGINGAYFSGPQRTEQTWYGSTNKTTATEYQYGDSYGNVTRQILYGDLTDNDDNRNVERSFVPNTTAYIVDRPQWEKLWTGTDSNGTLQARTDYLYDNSLVLGTVPTKGNLTEIRRYQTAGSYYPAYTGYDGYGRPTVLTDARFKQTVTAYHSFYGYVTSVTRVINGQGHVTSYVSDPKWGVVTQTTDPNNKATTLQYDSYGRLEKVWLPTEPTNGVASLVYSYDPASRPAYVQSSTLQVRTSATYLESRSYVDGFGRSLQSERPAVTSGYRVVSSQKYNNLGQLAYTSAPYQLTGNLGTAYAAPNWSSVANYHLYFYEELGRVWLDETKAGSSVLWSDVTIYDAWWHRRYDPKGNRADTYLDAFGQPVQVTEFNSGGASYNTAYGYDRQGNLTGVTDHLNNSTSIQYNLLGWKTGMTDPDMGTWSYSYDSVGNLQTQTDARGQTLYFKYDDLNRLAEKRQTNASGALIADYTFDAANQKGLLSKSRGYSGAGTTEVEMITYDARNRVTQQKWVVPGAGGGTFRFDYGYNEADQPITTLYPSGNAGQQSETVNYTYNSVGQMAGVSGTNTYVSSASYNPAGQLTQLAQPGLTRQRVYESNTLRLSVVKAGTTSPWDNRQNLTYAYDNAGNVTSLVDGQNGSGQKQCFQYDYLYRLTAAFTGNSGCTVYSATGTGPYNHTYAYNAIGNLTSYAGNSYTYGSSKPHAVTAAYNNSYAYDAVGNQTTRTIGGTVYTLVYDYENRLTEVKQGTTVLAAFVYDAEGNRVKGTVGGVTTVYIAGLYEYSGSAGKSYYTGPGGVVAMRSGSTVYYLLTDHLNSTARIVNSAGTTQSTSYYYPYGGNRGGAFSTLTTKRFTGQYHESTLPGGEGLYFYNARWYDAKLGRFVSADTLVPSPGNPQSFNRYAYVVNNPLKYTDPSGHAGITGNCMCGGSRNEEIDGLRLGASEHNKQVENHFVASVAESLPYADTPNDLLVAITGCGYACQAGYEEKVGWGWRIVAGVGVLLPIGYGSVKPVTEVGEQIVGTSSHWLGKWLDEFKPGQGFSGVFDPASGVFNLRPSANRADLPQGWVQQYTGHASMNEELTRLNSTVNPRGTVGFTVINKGGGELEVRWNSLSVNSRNWQERAAPVQFRQTIMEALAAWTGLKITGQ